MPTARILIFLFAALLVAACSGLAGDPEIVRTIPPRPTALPSAPETFDTVVSLERGALIYAENCTACHGITGAGNGELVLAGQVQNVPDFTDPQTIQETTLQEWFDTITNGRLENLMPPWRNALSARDRWAVALYTYTMSYDPAVIASGQVLYAEQCVICHAEDGTGVDDTPSLLGLAAFHENDLRAALAAHYAELGLSPALAETDTNALAQYSRLLSSTGRSLYDADAIVFIPPPAATEEVDGTTAATPIPIPQAVGVIRGRVIQGTADGGPVEGTAATVHIYDSNLREQIAEYTVGADGTYQYDEVVIRPDFAYRMTAEYDGLTYSSAVYIGDPAQTDMVIDVTVYERGADESALAITSRATQINLSAQGIYIIEVIDMVNNSDRAYIQDNVTGATQPVSVVFPIPAGAQLQLEHTNPNRILLREDGLAIMDIMPVLPNSEHYVQYSYLLPFENAGAIPQSVEYTVSGPTAFFVESSHLDFAGEGIELVGSRDFNNQAYNIYQVRETPQVGQSLTYAVSLRTALAADTGSAVIPQEVLALVFLVAGLVLVSGAGFMIWRGRHSEAPAQDTVTVETLIRQIAALDNAYEAGVLKKGDYQKQRTRLKNRLTQMMKTQPPDDPV